MKFLIVALVVVVVNAVAGVPAPMGSPPPKPGVSPKPGVQVVTMDFITEHAKAADEAAGITKREGCPADYCQNGGACVLLTEATFTGRDYVCKCNGDFGGYRCEVARPCLSCPVNLGAVYCVSSSIESTGRYCYDKNYQLVDAGKSRNKRFWWLAPLIVTTVALGK